MSIEDYPISILQQYLELLPNERLCSMVKAFLLLQGQPLAEEDEEEDGDSKRPSKRDEEEEDAFALASVGPT